MLPLSCGLYNRLVPFQHESQPMRANRLARKLASSAASHVCIMLMVCSMHARIREYVQAKRATALVLISNRSPTHGRRNAMYVALSEHVDAQASLMLSNDRSTRKKTWLRPGPAKGELFLSTLAALDLRASTQYCLIMSDQ